MITKKIEFNEYLFETTTHLLEEVITTFEFLIVKAKTLEKK